MKFVELLHNPSAGDKKHSKKKLTGLLEEHGYDFRYMSSRKKNWKDFDGEADCLIIAGGDGTVRKVINGLLKRKLLDQPRRIGLLPLGTANNISTTLGITGDVNEIMASWKNGNTKRYDVGRVYNVPGVDFFLEGVGYGIFPFVIKKMMEGGGDLLESPEEQLEKALKVFHETILSYKPHYCELKVNGAVYSGKYLLAEIMNTQCIGPNLCISPMADPGDGEFEVILVPESQRDALAKYVSKKLRGEEEPYSFLTVKGTDIRISWEGKDMHVDDQLIKPKKGVSVKVELKKGLLEFLVP